MNLDPIIARLKVATNSFKEVSDAAGFAQATSALQATPSAFVVAEAIDSGVPEFQPGFFQQRQVQTFAVVIAIGNAGPKGAAAQTKLDTLIDEVDGKLLNWMHPDADNVPVTGLRGRLLGLSANHVLWWQQSYNYRTLIRK